MNKKICLYFALLLILVCGCCFYSSAEEENRIVVNHVVYQLIPADKETLEHYDLVSFFDSEDASQTTTKITIPSEINGIPVTTIDAQNIPASDMYFNSVVEEIVLPDTITEIGKHAFVNMRNLSSIEIPASVTSLGYAAFSYCNSLKEITIPESVETIGFGCFARCKKLQEVNILGNGLKTIGKTAFSRCAKLQSVTLPASLQSIGRLAFFRSGLKSVRIPGSCRLDSDAFSTATKLKKVVFEDRTNDDAGFLSAGAFSNCSNLLKVYLPKQAPNYRIYGATFSFCRKLKAVYRTEHVTHIHLEAFTACESLTSFTIPAGIKQVDYSAFKGCDGLKKLRVLATDASVFVNHRKYGNCLQTLPDDCKIYVKTAAMKRAVADAGCTNKVIVKADLK